MSDHVSRHRTPGAGASRAASDGRSRPGTSRRLAAQPGPSPRRGPGAGSDGGDRSEPGRYRAGIELPERVDLVVDGRPVPAYPGESLAAALFAAGIRATRRTASGALRGPYCNMGVCFECLVTVDGVPAVRSCSVAVRPGMRVATDR